jgi:hypothetical protein
MVYDIYTRHESRIGFKEQATWGTAAVVGDAFKELPNDPGAVFNKDVKLRRPNRSYASTLGGQRMPDIRDVQNDTKGAAPTVTTSGDVRLADFGEILYLTMQGVTEDGTTPFEKQFEFPATQPDFTANEGMFGSVCRRETLASQSELLGDSIIRSATFTVHPENDEGRLHYSAEHVGRGPITEIFNPSGTWTRAAETFFYFHNIGGVLLDAVDIDIFSMELTISNNAIPVGVEVGGTGKFKSFALPKYTATAKINMLYTAATEVWMRSFYNSGTQTTFRIYWGNAVPAATGDLRIDMSSVVTAAPRILGDVHQIELSLECVTDVVTSGEDSDDHGLVIQLCDAVDRGW